MAGRGQKRPSTGAAPATPKTPRIDGAGGAAGAGGGSIVSTSASASASLSADHGTFKVNASYLAELDVAWQKINNHPVFQGLPRLQTAPMGMTGFDIRQFTESIDRHGNYTCGGNLFWADPFYTGTPGVPINRRGVLLQTCPIC